MARQRRRLARDPLHQVAVTGNHIGVVVNDLVTGAVVDRREVRFGEGDADRRADPLPERAGGNLDARRYEVLGMPWGLALPLPVALQLLHRQVVPDQMREAVLEHRAVPCGLNIAVAVDPAVVGGVELHEFGKQRVPHRRCAHRHSGMPGACGLGRVDSQRANSVDGALLERSHSSFFLCLRHDLPPLVLYLPSALPTHCSTCLALT